MMTRFRALLVAKLVGMVVIGCALLASLYGLGVLFVQLRRSIDGILLACFFLLPAVAAAMWRGMARDQRHRCRVCGKRLRMPLTHGSFANLMLNTPDVEYVCPFGCGKLRESLSITGPDASRWTRYGDIWQELFR